MIRTLSDLSAVELNTLFEVEYEILPILHAVGIDLSEEQIRSEILQKPDQSVILLEGDNGFIGLLRFVYSENNTIHVISLNIRCQTRTFLRLMYEIFEDVDFKKLKSNVQLSNKPSISFHEKLGLNEVKRGSQSILYEIRKEALLENLLRYIL